MGQPVWSVWKVKEMNYILISWNLFLSISKKLNDEVDNDVAKNTVYDDFLKNVNAIETSNLFNKTDYDAKIKDIVDKITSRWWCKNIRNWEKTYMMIANVNVYCIWWFA